MTSLNIAGRRIEAIVGHTGFVGKNLAEAFEFDHRFNSKNIGSIDGAEFEGVVISALYAEKWRANLHPEADLAHVKGVFDRLRTVKAKVAVLVSTVDVYDPPTGDENTEMPKELHVYGRNRLLFEGMVQKHFPEVYIVRLPALFGPHLKKNIIFDLLNNNQIEKINPASQFQWIDVRRVGQFVEMMGENQVRLLNMVTEPVSSGEIVEKFFPGLEVGASAGPVARYDIRTVHDGVLGRDDGYVQSRSDVLNDLERYLEQVRAT
jgi:nucleoside-diphosphate-sugar epimerase